MMTIGNYYKKTINILFIIAVLVQSCIELKAQNMNNLTTNPSESEYQKWSDRAKHMKFMGLPITGNYVKFGKKLEEKGFIRFPRSDKQGAKCYKKTNWAGQKLVYTYVVYSRNNMVDMVLVMIPFDSSLAQLSTKLDFIKRYKSRYGEPYTWPDRTDVKEFMVYEGDTNIGSVTLSDEDNYLRIMYFDEWGSENAIPFPKKEDEIDKDIF